MLAALLIIGFCEASVKLLGPVQVYVAPAIVPADKLSAEPAQTGELLLEEGTDGVWLIVTAVVPGELGGHPPTTALTE